MASGDPTETQRRLLDRHLDELDRWTLRLNLTTVRRDRAWERHVAESVALLDAAGPETAARCADLGSGGGIPGIPIAILRPDLLVTLIEADRRKAGFLVHTCGLLGLANVRVVDRRAEEMAGDAEHAGQYDVVFSRAAAPPPLLWTLAQPLLRVGGGLWALVSDADAISTAATPPAAGGARAARPAPGILAIHRLR